MNQNWLSARAQRDLEARIRGPLHDLRALHEEMVNSIVVDTSNDEDDADVARTVDWSGKLEKIINDISRLS